MGLGQIFHFPVCILFLGLNLAVLVVATTASAQNNNKTRPLYSFDADKRCKITSGGTSEELSKCVTLLRDEIRPMMGAGIPEIGFKPLEPIHFDTFEFNDGTTGPVVLRTLFKDVSMWGLTSYTKWTIWIDREAKTWSYDMFIPKMRLDGNYAMTGNVFIFPIGGNGTFYFNLKDFTLSGTNPLHIKVNKDGQKYIVASKSRINMDIKNIFIHLDNLFNGNQILGPVINNFLNENVQELFAEIKPNLEVQVGDIATYVINGLLGGVQSFVKYLDDGPVVPNSTNASLSLSRPNNANTNQTSSQPAATSTVIARNETGTTSS